MTNSTLYIDNQPYEVSSGKNLLEVCLSLGFDLPYFCWHPALGSVGACRQCAVKVFRDENDKKGKLIMSCMEPVTNNQRISISDKEAREFRDHVIEWLMTNHPHDCAVCDEGGSCHLQDMTVMTGHAYRKFRYKKRTYKNQNLGPFINHEMNRCIQCYRCVRYYKDYAGGTDLDAYASKNKVYFGRHEDGILESEFSGNLAEVCPTGVFTDKTLKQHYTRKWDLTMAPSVCHHCSLGCNTIAGERYGSLRMITNRYHGEVNGYFLCDRGRFGYEFVNAPDRIKVPVILNGATQQATINTLLKKITSLKGSKVIGIGSPRASLESNYTLMKLVGDENFYSGVSGSDYHLTAFVAMLLSNAPAKILSMKEVEKADAVFVLGEDLTNTAPMMALAVRQASRQQPLKKVENAKIPLWNDAAARELIQQEKGPVYVATGTSTKLDDVATQTHQASPDDLARLAFAVATSIDPSSPTVTDLTEHEKVLAKKIASGLMQAERPVIISGTSSGSESLLRATANVAAALYKKNSNAGLVLIVPECNSLGLALLGGRELSSAFEEAAKGDIQGAIILENDLYHQATPQAVDQFLSQAGQVVVIDHSPTATTQKASILIPTGTFAESDGTLVNNEGRAQRFFQVYEPANGIRESWRWLIQIAQCWENKIVGDWKVHQDVVRALAAEITSLKGVDTIAPPPNVRINGQKIPRQPHRYSGRTSMLANVNVSEQKPPEDTDSPMSYTMEGLRGQPPSSMIPFFWSPGWNSVQAVNKFQDEVGAALRGGDPGLRLFTKVNPSFNFYRDVPGKWQRENNRFLLVNVHHIFGSEALSARGAAVAKRVPLHYIAFNKNEAAKLQVKENDIVAIHVGESPLKVPVKINESIPDGAAALPQGLPELPYIDRQKWKTVTIEKI
jgi:NADH-quinone oxidoreductase subunit G